MTDDEVRELITRRRRQMLVHSFLYYRMDTNLWTDKQFDTKGRELARLQAEYPELACECPYADDFADWDATTGFHLKSLGDPVIINLAQSILRIAQRYESKTSD